MTWLVTGGAGYIGAHVVRALQREGMECVVLDDLSTGRVSNIPAGVPLVRGDVGDLDVVDRVVVSYQVTGCIHLAGAMESGFSGERPLVAYDSIVNGFAQLLTVLGAHRVDKVVYSSTAAVYGPPATAGATLTEGAPTTPSGSYGRTKLVGEWMLDDLEAVGVLRHTSLRTVNVMGSATPSIADTNPYHLLVRIFDDLRSGRVPHIHGAGFPTPDGTPVRDIVHVVDVAAAHVAAARRLDAGEPVEPAYNLGSGTGYSLRRIMEAVSRATGIEFEPDVVDVREGDPARVVATSVLAQRDLEWDPRVSLDEMVASSWAAWKAADVPA